MTLIKREDAIDAICDEWCYVTYSNCPHCDDGFKCDGCDDVKRLESLPSAELTLQTPQTYGKSINPSNAEVVEDYISRADAIEELDEYFEHIKIIDKRGLKRIEPISRDVKGIVDALPSAEAEKKKAELKENGDWDCPDVGCDECDHHRSVEWCSLAIPNHEKEIDETYKMVNEAFFEGFNAAEKRYRFLIEYVEELDKKLAEAEWIPCSERLPEVDVEVLTTTDWSDVLIAWLKKGGAWETEEYILANDEILAWMPLPKPYREDGEPE